MRCDLKICKKCSHLNIKTRPEEKYGTSYWRKGRGQFDKIIPSGDITFSCSASDEARERGTVVRIATMNIITDRQAKIKHDADFVLPTGCCYLLEQLMIQDIKRNPEDYAKSRGKGNW